MTRTASDLQKAGWPRKELLKYQPWQAIERYSQDQGLMLRRRRAWEVVREIADLLKGRYGAARVVVFGSLAHGIWFTPRSDIDLCVDGISVEDFFRAEKDVEAMAAEFKVDLVDPKECSEELLRQIKEEGLEL